MRHQSPPEWNSEEHTKRAAGDADPERIPERKAGPPAHDEEPRQHEDDGGERAGRRGDRLYDIVLDDGRVAEGAQHGHRNDGCGNRCREGETDLQSQIDIGGREHDRDQDAQNEAAKAELDGARRNFGVHEV